MRYLLILMLLTYMCTPVHAQQENPLMVMGICLASVDISSRAYGLIQNKDSINQSRLALLKNTHALYKSLISSSFPMEIQKQIVASYLVVKQEFNSAFLLLEGVELEEFLLSLTQITNECVSAISLEPGTHQ